MTSKVKEAVPIGNDSPHPLDGLSAAPAVAARAAAQQWSPSQRTLRLVRARSLKALRRFLKSNYPDHSRLMVRLCSDRMRQVIDDCRNLDRLMMAGGQEPIYSDAYAVSLGERRSLESLHWLAYKDVIQLTEGVSPTPTMQALAVGDFELARAKAEIDKIRETLRDGWTREEALRIHEYPILRLLQSGNTYFFELLGKTLEEMRRSPERYTRNLSSWITRAWMTLCLWECPKDGVEAYNRFSAAAALLEITVPQFTQFLNAWTNVRKRHMKGFYEIGAGNADQSAAAD